MTFVKPKRLVDTVFLHCSASEADVAGDDLKALIRQWHVVERGWSDIGYQFIIDRAGLVIPCRSLERQPAAQARHNARTIAICAHGNETFTKEQLEAVRTFCGEINTAFEGRLVFRGHCEVSPKTCPVYDYQALLHLDRWQRMP